jgi:UDP-glucuronate 4-epimerase
VLVKPPVANPAWDAVTASPASSRAPFRICNIGHSEPVELLYFIELLERTLGREAHKTLLPMQPGDVENTYADMSHLEALVGYRPQVSIEEGVGRFIDWFKSYHSI